MFSALPSPPLPRFARRAMEESLRRATSRRMFGQALANFQLTQAKLASMATDIDAAALLTYRAAWLRDQGTRYGRGRHGQE